MTNSYNQQNLELLLKMINNVNTNDYYNSYNALPIVVTVLGITTDVRLLLYANVKYSKLQRC